MMSNDVVDLTDKVNDLLENYTSEWGEYLVDFDAWDIHDVILLHDLIGRILELLLEDGLDDT